MGDAYHAKSVYYWQGIKGKFLVPRSSLKSHQTQIIFLARTNMYVIEIKASMFRSYMLDVPKGGCVDYMLDVVDVVMVGYMCVISYIMFQQVRLM